MSEAEASYGPGDDQGTNQGSEDSQSVDDGRQGATKFVSREEFETFNAKIDMLADSFSEIRNSFAQRNQSSSQSQVEEEDFDDDEPLTASKVARIVAKQTRAATSAQAAESERQRWDGKAATEFPLSDPKFQLEFKRQWRESANAGMDVRHPRSMYHVAKMTAQLLASRSGSTAKKASSARSTDDQHEDSEAPTSRGGAMSGRKSKSSIDDSDPRVAFYRMKGSKTEAQIAAFKERLAEKDAKRRSR